MTSKTIVFSTSAGKGFEKLPLDVQERLIEALFVYGIRGIGDVKRMVGTPTKRMRVGDYRIIFDESAEVLDILAVGNRSDIYR